MHRYIQFLCPEDYWVKSICYIYRVCQYKVIYLQCLQLLNVCLSGHTGYFNTIAKLVIYFCELVWSQCSHCCCYATCKSPLSKYMFHVIHLASIRTLHCSPDLWQNGSEWPKTADAQRSRSSLSDPFNHNMQKGSYGFLASRSSCCSVCHLASSEILGSLGNWKTAAGTLVGSINIHVLHIPMCLI